jgi:hypothetical protein
MVAHKNGIIVRLFPVFISTFDTIQPSPAQNIPRYRIEPIKENSAGRMVTPELRPIQYNEIKLAITAERKDHLADSFGLCVCQTCMSGKNPNHAVIPGIGGKAPPTRMPEIRAN